MSVIHLPAHLPGVLSMAAVNQQLRTQQDQLDWSAVVEVEGPVLAQLLSGLDLSDNAEELGFDTITSETILDAVEAYFEQADPPPGPPKKKAVAPDRQNAPEVWEQTSPAPGAEEAIPVTTSEDLDLYADEVEEIPDRILQTFTPYQIRQQLEAKIVRDLLGPVNGPEEEIDEGKVSDRYLVGLLAPQKRDKNAPLEEEIPELQEPLEVAGTETAEDGKSERSGAASKTIFPSSFGMTFCVSSEAKALYIIAGWGQYERTKSDYIETEQGNPKTVWKRYPIRKQSDAIPLREGTLQDWQIHPDFAVFVRGKIRQQNGCWIISLFLVNARVEPPKQSDSAWLFQPELSVISATEQADIFLKRPHRRPANHKLDAVYYGEEEMMNMLYRQQVEFAVGHGIGVHATTLPEDPTRATQLSTTVIPAYEVPKATPPTVSEEPKLEGLVLEMKAIAGLMPEELPDRLAALPAAYEQWIQTQRSRLNDPDEGLEDYQSSAQTAMENCDRALSRIKAGIETLRTNPQAARAFLFMNRAMHLQRVRSIYSSRKRQGKEINLDAIESPKWYPFQLAFILLNLPSTTDLTHPDRCHPTEAVSDLLWFPTGGGKTEAYLGLAAYTMGLRRLQGTIAGRSGLSGVAVLMRYTLRLLTLQQFQRATALICACEVIRRENVEIWGAEPFRIGLWVGMKTTPNRTKDSEAFVEALKARSLPPSGGSPHQLTSCPWCGTEIDEGRHISVSSFSRGNARTLVHCGDILGHCPFSRKQSKSEGLPVVVVDEEIYRRLPTLLIATVDKFAQMPWKGETQMLFGRVSGYCDRHGYRSPEIDDADSHPAKFGLPKATTKPINNLRPPDLIIQDELHLISGPLGTLVGLYETAIDQLASWEVDGKTIRPKVIASTATIRQAQSQMHDLFLRKVEVFPPQGLDISDNFFSRQRTPGEEFPGRRYLGICATGRRLKAATIRVYTAILSASQDMYERAGEKADPWMTLVGYFNSMRELGGTRRLVDDDIQQRLNKMEQRGLASRRRLMVEELTSRKSSTDIPIVLDWMETPFVGERKRRKDRKTPLDVLLATNMISVGVDVGRLGIMAVTGQPKTTAEYIQSTSRVGRQHPGIVVTIFNWARPRDLSHYERFEHYHATFYQHVESLSLTPFSAGATDRGLAALLVSLIRLKTQEYNLNKGASRISREDPNIQRAIKQIVERAWHVSGDPAVRDFVERELNYRLDYWLAQAQDTEGGRELGYKTEKDDVTIGLLSKPGAERLQPFTCLNSLRNVEPSIGLILNPQVPEDNASPPQPMPANLTS